jgi:hypothetical protein
MAWPELAQELWTCTRTHACEGHRERARDSILDFAAVTTSGLAVDAVEQKLYPTLPNDLVEILAWLPTGISTMIVEVEWSGFWALVENGGAPPGWSRPGSRCLSHAGRVRCSS